MLRMTGAKGKFSVEPLCFNVPHAHFHPNRHLPPFPPMSQFLSVPEVELYCEPTNRDKNPKESRQRKAYNKGFVSKILCIT